MPRPAVGLGPMWKERLLTSTLSSRNRCTARPSVAVLAPAGAVRPQENLDKIKGLRLITALKTPYLRNGKIDLAAFDRVVENQVSNGVEGVIIGGTTGEGQLMSWDEHIMLIAHTVNVFGARLCVIGNTGSNSTREALHASEQGFAVGMHAALQINPYYGKTSEAGLAAHFEAVLNEGPTILYNVPARTGQDIPDRIVERCAQHVNFLGVKECTGPDRISSYSAKGITCWSGNDDDAHRARHEHGGQGVISVASNLVPGAICQLMSTKNDALADALQDLNAWLFCEPNPTALNTAMAMCGLVQPVFRLPYLPLDRPSRQQGAKLLEAVAEHLPGVTTIRVMEDTDFEIIARY